jgi:hypothetical protein
MELGVLTAQAELKCQPCAKAGLCGFEENEAIREAGKTNVMDSSICNLTFYLRL